MLKQMLNICGDIGCIAISYGLKNKGCQMSAGRSHEIEIRVRFAETDIYGLVHHSNFFVWFEMGRIEFLRSIGLTLDDFESEGIYLPIRDASCCAHSPIKNDELLIQKTALAEITPIRIVFNYEVAPKGAKKIAVTGQTTNIFVDSDGKPKRLSSNLLGKIQQGV